MKRDKLAIAILLTVLLGIMVLLIKPENVLASPPKLEFADQEELSSRFNFGGGTVSSIKYGAQGRTWLITGKEDDDTIVLLATKEFAKSIYGKTSTYADSTLKGLLGEYISNTDFFSEGEKAYMKEVEVSTEDADGALHTDAGVLYLPDAKEGRNGWKNTVITVGTSNNVEIPLEALTEDNGFNSICFWLRSPREDRGSYAQLAFPEGRVGCMLVGDAFGVLPVFHLDLSQVAFASTACAASEITVSEEKELASDTAMTIRFHAGKSLGTAILSEDQNTVTLKKVPENTYFVVQNSDGIYADILSNASPKTIVEASSITIHGQTLNSFENCKVWLETTNGDRITTACMATLKGNQLGSEAGVWMIGAIIATIIIGSAVCFFVKRNRTIHKDNVK